MLIAILLALFPSLRKQMELEKRLAFKKGKLEGWKEAANKFKLRS